MGALHELPIRHSRPGSVADSGSAEDRAANVASITIWIKHAVSLVDLCISEQRWNELRFWGRAVADLTERRVEVENGADARREIHQYEDILFERRHQLQRMIDRDDARISEEPAIPIPPTRRSRNAMDRERAIAMRGF